MRRMEGIKGSMTMRAVQYAYNHRSRKSSPRRSIDTRAVTDPKKKNANKNENTFSLYLSTQEEKRKNKVREGKKKKVKQRKVLKAKYS